jgi:hypothetical protein
MTIERHNDWDSYEQLHVFIEQLEVAERLLRSRSHSRWRAAVILLDHVADSLMYRLCIDDFANQEFLEMVIPPAVPREKRDKILFRFTEKLTYMRTKKAISTQDATVMGIGHKIRNFAYHRNYHNPETIGMVGRILYKTICAALPRLFKGSRESYSSRTDGQTWARRFGVTPSFFNLDEVLLAIGTQLSDRIKLTLPMAAKVFKTDLSARYSGMQSTLKHWLRLRTDRRLNEMLKHYEFADVRKEELFSLLQPVKDARHALHDLYKGSPPEEWEKLIALKDPKRDVSRRMVEEEKNFKNKQHALFMNYRQTITARALRGLGREIRGISNQTTFADLLLRYDSLERLLTQAESYVSRAEADLDVAIDIARGK